MNFALMPPAAQAVSGETEKPREGDGRVLPEFKRRWWYSRRRLDARPVIWSLQNHPEEWRQTFMCVLHIKSGHEFWGPTAFSTGLWRADQCDCSIGGTRTTKFQIGQAFWFRRAARKFLRSLEPDQNELRTQFASHFIK